MNIDIMKLQQVSEKRVEYQIDKINSPQKVYDLAKDILKLHLQSEEQFYILCLNTKKQINAIHLVSQGDVNSSIVHPREVFKRALLSNATALILLHNHPTGDSHPSENDNQITKRLQNAGDIMGVRILDHLIICKNEFYSYKGDGKI